MKQFCVFISFVVVKYVLADKLADYTNEVAFTNRQIKLVNSRSEGYMRELIKGVICGTTPMEEISIMIAVPDMIIDVNGEIIEMKQQLTIDEVSDSSHRKLKRSFFALMKDLRVELDLFYTDIGTSDAGNKGIDDSVVKDESTDNPEVKDESIDDTDVKGKSIDDSDVNDKIPKIDENGKDRDERLQQYIDFQIELQNLITSELDIDESNVIEESTDNPEVKDEKLTSEEESDSRDERLKPSFFASMKNLRAEFDRLYTAVGTLDAGNKDEACRKKLSELGIERRYLISLVVQELLGIKDPGKSVVDRFTRSTVCRLRGLDYSVLYPQTFVIKAEVVGNECYLTGTDNITYKG